MSSRTIDIDSLTIFLAIFNQDMASTAGATSKSPKVIVTGFGANIHHPTNKTSNPAGIIASGLPTSFPSTNPLNCSGRDIGILDGVAGGWAEINASHKGIRDDIRNLHEQYGDKVNLFVHLGRSPWEFLTVERRAFRQDMTCTWLNESAEKEGYYINPDNNNSYVRDMEFPWKDAPMGLQTEIPVTETVEFANKLLEGARKRLEVKPHFEPGNLGCGYAYYESMANTYMSGRKRHVIFCHVPSPVDEESIEAARNSLLAVIGAAFKALEQQKKGGPVDFRMEFGNVQ